MNTTLVPEVFLHFSPHKELRGSREAVKTRVTESPLRDFSSPIREKKKNQEKLREQGR